MTDVHKEPKYISDFLLENRDYFIDNLLDSQKRLDRINKGVYEGKF